MKGEIKDGYGAKRAVQVPKSNAHGQQIKPIEKEKYDEEVDGIFFG